MDSLQHEANNEMSVHFMITKF